MTVTRSFIPQELSIGKRLGVVLVHFDIITISAQIVPSIVQFIACWRNRCFCYLKSRKTFL